MSKIEKVRMNQETVLKLKHSTNETGQSRSCPREKRMYSETN